MTIDTVRDYCLSKPGASEGMPFGDGVLVFKVLDKMFCLMNLVRIPLSIGLKCDPERAVELRDQYEAIQAAYHMNKKHWNTVIFDGSIPETLMREMIDDSYALVVQGMRKADREVLSSL